MTGLPPGTLVSSFSGPISQGVSAGNIESEQQFHGPNLINVEVPSYLSLLVEEVLHPFYIFQICSITLWMCDDYYYYASCIIIISLISICVSLYETRRQAQSLHDMVTSGNDGSVTVLRPGTDTNIQVVANRDLVPGKENKNT